MNTLLEITRRRFLSAGAAAAAYALAPKPAAAYAGSDLPASAMTPTPKWRGEGVIDLSNSPHAKLRTVPVSAVLIREGFWSKRRATNVEASIPSMHDELLAHGRLDNFLRLSGKSAAPQVGPYFSDSDIYKWVEAVGFALQSGDLPELRRTTEGIIGAVIAVQEPSGYLNTYFVESHRPERMLPHTQQVGHELYCLGHMLQAAIAYYRATGDPTLLNAGIRFVDQFLLPNFGPAPNQQPIVSGHPEIEMSLIELYRTTGNRHYLDLAGYILRGDDRIPLKRQEIVYMFCGSPFTSRTKLEGHAVRAMYACCGATDYYMETGNPSYLQTLNTLWHDLSEHQMYITGGVGARSQGEAFGNPYELPNATAYGESCAAIGNMMWNWRMLSATGDARHADVMERALYNGINSGMSLDGKLYCYRNPLAHDPTTGDKIRNPWYDVTCCPPNLERTFASLPGYFYSIADDGVYVHLYDNSEMNWHLANGNPLKLKQQTNYPWEGTVQLTVAPAAPETFTLYVRVPGWSRSSRVTVDGKEVEGVVPGRYLPIRRRWTGSETVALSFDMETRPIQANPAVTEDTDRVALQRGPIVFCMEQLDQADRRESKDFYLYSARLTEQSTAKYDDALLSGVVTLEHPGSLAAAGSPQALYQESSPQKPEAHPTMLKLIPYYAWANRADSAMQVWIPIERA
jgi:uncharacterized protein